MKMTTVVSLDSFFTRLCAHIDYRLGSFERFSPKTHPCVTRSTVFALRSLPLVSRAPFFNPPEAESIHQVAQRVSLLKEKT